MHINSIDVEKCNTRGSKLIEKNFHRNFIVFFINNSAVSDDHFITDRLLEPVLYKKTGLFKNKVVAVMKHIRQVLMLLKTELTQRPFFFAVDKVTGVAKGKQIFPCLNHP